MIYLLDANVLLRSRQVAHPLSQSCQELLDPERCPRLHAFVCAQTLIEYWVVATRPQNVNGLGMSTFDARTDLDAFAALFKCLPEPPDMFDRWRRLVTHFDVQGLPSHDTRLVALMDAHGITGLITLNRRDFTRYPHVMASTPQEWLDTNPLHPTP